VRTSGAEKARNGVKKYAAKLGLLWDDYGFLAEGEVRAAYPFLPLSRVTSYTLTYLISDAIIVATVWRRDSSIYSFELYPLFSGGYMLPLWLAYPKFNSMTIGWRMGSGEHYKYRWHRWYRGLSGEQRADYKLKYPPPDDGAWGGFYEDIADVPAKPESLADIIMGRVP
jgi:hypothetical protein